MNTWMNNPQFLAQIGHSLGGLSIILVTAYFTHGFIPVLVAAGAIVVAAAIKEFWYDANYELPKQTSTDNWMDFGFYMVGMIVGLGVVALKLFVLKLA